MINIYIYIYISNKGTYIRSNDVAYSVMPPRLYNPIRLTQVLNRSGLTSFDSERAHTSDLVRLSSFHVPGSYLFTE